jgi:hypothetical protein
MKSLKRRSSNLIVLLFSLLGLATLALAQSAGAGALTGTVSDPSAAVIANVTVTVTVTDNDTGQTRTRSDGVHAVTLFPPGSNRVTFSANGFKTAQVDAVRINVTETPVLDRRLEVGSQTEQVTMQANAEPLQTASSALGTTHRPSVWWRE